MKKLYMKFLLLCTMMLCGSGAWAEDVVYKTALFGTDYNDNSVGSYTETWTATNNGFTVSLANFNNNKNDWSYVKCGRKNNASVATITTSAAIDKAITKVEVTIDAITAANVNSIKLYTSSNGSSWSEVGSYTAATGAQTVSPASPAANLYYKVEFDCASGSSNGLVTVSKVDFYYAASDPGKTDVTLSFPEDSYDASLFGSFTEPTLTTTPNGLTVSYSSSDTDVAIVDAESGEVTMKAEGSTEITATFAGDETYNGGSASYTLNVTDSRTASELIFAEDSYNAEVDGSFDAPELGTDPKNIDVTYSSSNTDVATVNAETGAVTIIAKGTTTITATFAGNAEYKGSSASYTLTVTKPQSAGTVFYESFDKCEGTGGRDDTYAGSVGSGTINYDNNGWAAATKSGGAKECVKFGTGSDNGILTTPTITIYGNATLTFSAAGWGDTKTNTLAVTATNATLDGDTDITLENGEWTDYTVNITEATGAVTITFTGKRGFIDDVLVELPEYTRSVTAGNYGTVCVPFAASVTGADIFTVSGKKTEGGELQCITLEPVAGDLTAGVGYIFQATGSELKLTPKNGTTVAAVTTGAIKGTYEEDAAPDNTYILSNNKIYGTGETGYGNLSANRAYIDLTNVDEVGGEAKGRMLYVGGATAIESIEADKAVVNKGIYYNMAGQRIAAPTKGLYIVNGKKVIIK